jgi:hypothetical protein
LISHIATDVIYECMIMIIPKIILSSYIFVFCVHLEYIRHLEYILNFHDWQQIFYSKTGLESITYQKIKIFHSAVPLPKNYEFLCKKSVIIKFFGHFEFLRRIFFFVKDKKFAALVQQWHNVIFISDFPCEYYYENR